MAFSSHAVTEGVDLGRGGAGGGGGGGGVFIQRDLKQFEIFMFMCLALSVTECEFGP